MSELNIKLPDAYKDYYTKLNDYYYYMITGGRGSGKSMSAGALSCLIEASLKKEKVLCLREIQNSIDDSVYALLKDCIESYKIPNYIVQKDRIFNTKTGSVFIFAGMYRNIAKIKSIPGITKVWFEEADKISQDSLDLLLPTIREKGSRALFTFNPMFETDPIWQEFMIKRRTDTFYLHTTLWQNPYVSQKLIDQALRMKETNYKKYLNIYEGELRQEGDDTLISLEDFYAATERLVPDDGATEYGLDLARYGDDQTVLTKRKGLVMKYQKEKNKLNGPQIVAWVKHQVGNKTDVIKVDLGYMPGVYDQLKADGYNAIGLNFGELAKDKDRYSNLISEMWHEFNDMIKTISLINIDRLKRETTRRKYKIDKKGRLAIESKDDYKKREGHSCDYADSMLLCYYKPKQQNYYSFV